MFDDIRRGGTTTPKRPNVRDRGLTVKHLMRFFDSTAWSGLDDSDTVRMVLTLKFLDCYLNFVATTGILLLVSKLIFEVGER